MITNGFPGSCGDGPLTASMMNRPCYRNLKNLKAKKTGRLAPPRLFPAGFDYAVLSAANTLSGVNGAERIRTPTAS
jgi:hypothetical protein